MKFNRFILIFVIVFGGCSEDNWTKSEQDKFVDDCVKESGDKAYCECFMKKAMEKYPVVEDAEEMKFEEAVELSKECE